MNASPDKDRFKKTLRMGVLFDGEMLTLLDGTPIFPALREGCVAELIVSPECVSDVKLATRLSAEVNVPLLEEGSDLMFGVGPNMLGAFREGLVLSSDLGIFSPYVFVPVRLVGPLFLRIRGDQEARLSGCVCTIPTLKIGATSLNHAFTIISEAYETERRSHSGNAFERVYAEVKPRCWSSLADHRLRAIAGLQPVSNAK